MTYGPEHVIYETKLTVDALVEIADYLNDEENSTFTDAEINQLTDDLNDAVQQTIEDFLNHR
jgi:predicted solute-binding protein